MLTRNRLVIAALLAAIPIHHADADEELEIGGFAGVHLFNDDNELGQDDYSEAGSLENAMTFGVRVARSFAEMVSAEGELAIVPSNMRIEDVDVVVFGWRVQGLYHPVRLDRFEPFALFGVGGSTAASSDLDLFHNDTDLVVHAGLGLEVALGDDWGVRLDGRLALPPSSESESVTADGEILLGLYKGFGPPAPPAAAPAPCPPAPAPPSKDPADPRDGVQTRSEPQPPLPPLPADADGDGMTDDKDRCPKEAETANGFDDTDGCPDEIPPEVKKLTGVISGIEFAPGTAVQLTPGSGKVLDEAALMLKKYPTVRIEISGHTDSSGDEAQNRTLSQKRADAVRDYLIQRGIAADRLASKGYGPEFPIGNNATPEGRARNRRVEFKLLSP
jgi:OOP family OmpA-OmpF porin